MINEKNECFIIVIVVVLVFSACFAFAGKVSAVPEQETEKVELVVFAAASMTESMNKIAEMYAKIHPDVKISYNFDSIGTKGPIGVLYTISSMQKW